MAVGTRSRHGGAPGDQSRRKKPSDARRRRPALEGSPLPTVGSVALVSHATTAVSRSLSSPFGSKCLVEEQVRSHLIAIHGHFRCCGRRTVARPLGTLDTTLAIARRSCDRSVVENAASDTHRQAVQRCTDPCVVTVIDRREQPMPAEWTNSMLAEFVPGTQHRRSLLRRGASRSPVFPGRPAAQARYHASSWLHHIPRTAWGSVDQCGGLQRRPADRPQRSKLTALVPGECQLRSHHERTRVRPPITRSHRATHMVRSVRE